MKSSSSGMIKFYYDVGENEFLFIMKWKNLNEWALIYNTIRIKISSSIIISTGI